jgi:sugar lactone lactonase YvrE
MSKKAVAILLAVFAASAAADDEARFPRNATFTTLIATPLAIEGLTGDAAGNLYTTGRDLNPDENCPVWRINIASPSLVTVGFIPNAPGMACSPSGIAFDELGNLYIADGGAAATVWKLRPNASTPPLATAFATGVPGTNGLAFDRDGNLWTGDGTTGNGRVWRIAPSGGVCEPTFTGCAEVFRIQPMANVLPAVPSGVANVGRDTRALPPGTINAQRQATNTAGSQPLVANGVAFDEDGDFYVADTARGALWKVGFDRRGNVRNRMGCDTTFTPNTLCLDSVFVAHPYLEGTDGIALDRAGTIWGTANERNAVVTVSRHGRVVEFFRNPVNAAGLRNAGDTMSNHVLEFPTSPFVGEHRLCVANSDGNRRDNSPNSAGEINSGGPVGSRGKISCMDQPLNVPG